MQVSVSKVWGTVLEIVKARLGSLVGLWLVYFAIQMFVSAVAFMFIGASVSVAALEGDPNALGAMGLGMLLFMAIIYLGYVYIASAQSAAMSRMASPLVQTSFGDAFSSGFANGLTLLGTTVLLLLGYLVGLLVLGMVGEGVAMAGVIAQGVWSIALAALLIYLACRLIILPPVVAVEGVRNPITAIVRSWQLTKGKVLGIFLSLLVYIAIAIVAVGVPFAMFFGTIIGLSQGDVGPAIGAIFGMVVIFAVLAVLLAVLGSTFGAVVHSELVGHETAE